MCVVVFVVVALALEIYSIRAFCFCSPQKFMRASEYAVATKIEELLVARDTGDTSAGISASALLGGKGGRS